MIEKGLSFLEAANYVRKRRPIVFPNFGFQKQLIELEEILKKKDEESFMSKMSKKTKLHKQKTTESKTVKNSMRNSMRAKSSNKMPSSKNSLTYKEKAKFYYLGMQNNWIDDTNLKLLDEYRSKKAERKSQTAHNPITNQKNSKEIKIDNQRNPLKINSKPLDGVSVRSPNHYKRINRKYYKNKIQDDKCESPEYTQNETKQVKYLSAK